MRNDASLDQELGGKLVTDLRVTYKFTPNLTLTGIINNAFDVYPDITNPTNWRNSWWSFPLLKSSAATRSTWSQLHFSV